MKKKAFFALLPVLVLLSLAACGSRRTAAQNSPAPTAEAQGEGSAEPQALEDGRIHISTPEEFLHIADDLSGKYVLDEDIDDWWGGVSTVFSPIGTPDEPFTGELDGNGHMITGTFAYTGQEEAWGFFGCNEGLIHDLTIGYVHAPEMQERWDSTFEENYTLASLQNADLPTDATRYYSVLCGVNRGTIENITFKEYSYMPNIYCYPNENDKIYVGYAAAYNDGVIRGVSFSSTGLEMRTLDQYTAVDVGIVCGYQTTRAVMEDVSLKLNNTLWLAGWGMYQFIAPDLNAGLLIGEAEGATTVRNSTAVMGGQVDGSSTLAGAVVRLGGLIGCVRGDIELSDIGASDLQVFHDGQNSDSMKDQSYTPASGALHCSGGLVGWADGNVTLSDLILHNVSAQTILRPGGDPQPSCVGGFVGHCGGDLVAHSLSFDGEYAASDASVEQGVAYAGGVCGYCGGTAEISDSSIAVSMNPLFHGSVIYESNVIGYLCGEGSFSSLRVTGELDDNGESMGHSLVADRNSTYYLASIAGYAESSVSVRDSYIDVVYSLFGTPGAVHYDESCQGMYNAA